MSSTVYDLFTSYRGIDDMYHSHEDNRECLDAAPNRLKPENLPSPVVWPALEMAQGLMVRHIWLPVSRKLKIVKFYYVLECKIFAKIIYVFCLSKK